MTCLLICGLIACGVAISSFRKRRFSQAIAFDLPQQSARKERDISPIYDTIDPRFYELVLPEKVYMSVMTDNAAYMMNNLSHDVHAV